MRDLLTVLGIDRVTVVGHSFGGGVAMQFAYQFPERAERLVLVASGGLGPEVSPAIRAITTPGFHRRWRCWRRRAYAGGDNAALRLLASSRVSQLRDLGEVADLNDWFKDPRTRAAIAHVVRAVVDWRGQIVTMADRAYLTEAMPMCVVWGSDDQVIPVSRQQRERARATARIEVLPNAGHFPHKDHPERFARIVRDFIRSTAPSHYDRERWRELIEEGAFVPPIQAEAGSAPLTPVHSVRRAAGA